MLALIVGITIGAVLGTLCTALCVAAKRGNETVGLAALEAALLLREEAASHDEHAVLLLQENEPGQASGSQAEDHFLRGHRLRAAADRLDCSAPPASTPEQSDD